MMTDIFSMFDSNHQVILSLTSTLWIMSMILVLVASPVLWPFSNQSMIWNTMVKVVSSQTLRTKGKNIKGFLVMLNILFFFIISTNLSGMIPYNFSSTSHLMLSFSLSSVFWLSLIYLGAKKSLSHTIAHFLPEGAPAPLNPFLSIVELSSILVRPITLSIRLTANISAGHIVLGLLGSYLSSFLFTTNFFFLLSAVHIFYFLFEFAVCLIQAYIFVLLLTLYSDDMVC
uniref:ATP synthase subunit a n=1 Tax=Scutopus robustus TaxID=2109553 RepID=A0A343YNB1_9MOLL|nr:ATP synthase F0 subunit 6 [Scutopus robustus]AWL21418.1 ATP synthase F0 subunit 6 [Scutopus robustus]